LRIKIIILALLLALCPLAARAEDEGDEQQFSVSLDILGNGAFAKKGPSFSPGFGGSLFGDWRPLPYLSLGTGFDFTHHSDFGSWQTASWDLGGRIFPLGTDKSGEWYLQGSLGLNLDTRTLKKEWPGDFHGAVGIGYRAFVNSGNALDFGAQYDLYSPMGNPLQDLGVKVGWTLLFGKNPGEPEVKASPAIVATPVSTPQPSAKAKKRPRKKKAMAQVTPQVTPPPAADAPSPILGRWGTIWFPSRKLTMEAGMIFHSWWMPISPPSEVRRV
jgi:hypothetical protein